MTELLRQFRSFSLVGVVAAVIHYGLLVLLVSIAGIPAVTASVIGYAVAACANYYLNYQLTFRSAERHLVTVPKFIFFAGVGFFLNWAIMGVGVRVLSLHYLLVQIVATGIVLFWNFFGNRHWTFRGDSAL